MKFKKKVKKLPNGGKAPIKGTKEQYQAYQDSLDLYNFGENAVNFVKNQKKYTRELVPNTEEARKSFHRLTKLNGVVPNQFNTLTKTWTYPDKHKETLSAGHFTKPVQPIIYEPGEKSKGKIEFGDFGAGDWRDENGYIWTSKYKEADNYKPRPVLGRPKQTPIQIESKQADLLQGSNQELEFNPIPFKKGTYFTRPRQSQEQGSRSLTDYFDKKTGKLLGTYRNGGEISLDEFRPKFQSDKTKINKVIVDPNKGFQNPIPKNKQEWYNKSSGRVEESISPLDIIPMGALNTGSRLINNAYKLYSKYNKFADFVNGYELYNDLNKIPENKTQKFTMGGNISRFEVPIQQAEGLDPFKLPYNEIATALLSKQKSYDEQEAEMAKNQAFLADLKSGYRTAGLPQEIQSHYNDRFQNYIGKDLTDPTIKKSLVQDIANLKGDSRLRTLAADIKQSALWDNYQQAHPDLAGSAVNPYNINGQWVQAKNEDGTWQNEQQINNWYGNITPYSDPNKEIDDAFSKVKENTKSKIVESNPSATFHVDPETGKEYYTTTTTGTDKKFINESLPQWQAAATEQAINFEKGATPGSNYFKARFAPEIQQDPDFIRKYISTAGGKYVYNRESESTKYDIHNTGSGSNGSGGNDGNVSSSMGTTTQILRQNTAIPKGELPTNTIKNYQARTNQILETYNKQGYKTGTDEDGFKILEPKPNETISETSAREAENTTLRLLQQKESNATSIHKALAIKYNLDPSIPLEKQLKDPKILEKAQNARYHELNKTTQALPGSGVIVSASNQEGRIKAGNEAYLKVLKQDENFKNYVTDLEALQKGVTESGVLTYPLTDSKQEALRSSAQAALSNPVNYKLGDQGSIEYLQSNDNVSDGDKKEITKYLSKNKDALNGVSSVMWDREKGEYAVLVNIPKEDGSGTINVKISGDKNLPGLATAARQLDALYYDNDRSVARDKYQQYEEKTDGNNGLLIHPQLPKSIVTTHLPTTEDLPGGKSINQGETVFTLPELPNILLRMQSFDKMYEFLTFYNNPQNGNIVKDPQQLLKAVRDYSLEDIAVPDKIYNKYEQPIREVKQESPKQ